MNIVLTVPFSAIDEAGNVLNEARPAQWCERCQCVHAGRPAGEFDRHISEQAKALADAIDAEFMAKWAKDHP